jgi:hypothetical protein
MITQSDLTRMAAALSGVDGNFPSCNLVSYGQTVIVKPGATTDQGVPVTGEKAQAALAKAGYQAFPLAVEYGPTTEEVVAVYGATAEQELDELELDLESEGDEDEMGDAEARQERREGRRERRSARKEARLKARYMKVYARLTKCEGLLEAGRGYTPPGLLALPGGPFIYLASLFRGKDRKLEARARKCDRVLRRLLKVRQRMERKGLDVSDLPDPRDIGRRVKQGLLASSPREQMVYRAPAPMPMQRPWVPGPPRRAPGGYVPTSQAVSPYYLADQAALEREMAEIMPDFGGAEDLASDLRATADGYPFTNVEHDYFGVHDGEFELMFADDEDEDLLESVGVGVPQIIEFPEEPETMGAEEDDDLDDDDDDLLEDPEGAFERSLRPRVAVPVPPPIETRPPAAMGRAPRWARGMEAAGRRYEKAQAGLRRPQEQIEERVGKKLALQRRKLLVALGRAQAKSDYRTVAQIQSRIAKIDAKLQKGSANGGIDYGRVRPRQPTSEGPVILVIGIRKRGEGPSKVGSAYQTEHESSPLLAALIPGLYNVTEGYTAPEAVATIRQQTTVTDYLGGSVYPDGDGAPLPPPRMAGPEVYGG